MPILYLSAEQIIEIHDMVINEFGGGLGLRGQGLLESAAYQPRQSFGGEDLYPDLFDKASVYAFSISENQPFIDGNKRTAVSTASLFLEFNGYLLSAPRGQLYGVMMALANKKMSRDNLAEWVQKNSKPLTLK